MGVGSNTSMVKQKELFLNPGLSSLPSPDTRLFGLSLKSMLSKNLFLSNEAGKGGIPLTEKKRIMLVDDEHDICAILKSGLERKGFLVDTFNNPKEALALFRPGHYDILLIDVRMPDMNGFELCLEIKKKDCKPRAFFVSAFEVNEEELKEFLPEESLRCVVKKPISIKELVKIIGGAS